MAGKKYYKLSQFDSQKGIVGHECINEIIIDRLLTILGIEHLHYELILADIEIDDKIYTTYLCRSEDFKERGESKWALDDYYDFFHEPGESRYDFCVRNGWQQYIDEMLAVDYLIANRDRHGANIEVLRNARKKSIRIAPLFDHGLSLLFSCMTDEDAKAFEPTKDVVSQNYIGSRSCFENLSLINNKPIILLKESDKDLIFKDLENALSPIFIDKIWKTLIKRSAIYNENF